MAVEIEAGATSIVIDGGRQIIERATLLHADDEAIQELATDILEFMDDVDDVDRCHKCLSPTDDLMECSRCQKVLYCDRVCQKGDFKCHQKICKQIASRPVLAGREKAKQRAPDGYIIAS